MTKDKQQRIIEAYEAALLARNYADCSVLDIVPEIEEAVPDASFPEIIAAIKVITDREIQEEEQKAAEDQKAVDDLCWARYERAEREHNVEQWLASSRISALRQNRPEFLDYIFRLIATRLQEQGRPVPQIISDYLATESNKAN